MLGLAREQARPLAIGTVFLLLGSASTLAFPKAVESLLDEALIRRGTATVDRAAALLLCLFVFQGAATGARAWLFTAAGERIVAGLRRSIFAALVRQETAFFDQNRSGELLSRLSSDAQILQTTVSANVSMLLRNVVSATGGLILLVSISARLTGLMLLVVPIVAVGAVLFGRRVRSFSKAAQDALAESGDVAASTLAGIRTVKAFHREAGERERYDEAIATSVEASMKRAKNYASFSGFGTGLGGVAVAAVLWSGGRMVQSGDLSTGELTSFVLYTVIVAFSLGALTDLWGDFMRASGAAERVFELIDRAPRLNEGERRFPGRPEGRLDLNGVHFSYPSRPNSEILKGIDLSIDPGERVALVGPSGAGKSTISSLVLRLYDPTRGEILFDGIDLKELRFDALRSHVAIVSQEPTLVRASVAENIRYGRPEATDEEVAAAARAANADEFIRSFPEGYATQVGERGIQLSGGQKQRVAIARALIENPRVLVLDEATSALDAESEHAVQQALEHLMKGRTTLIIAHRLSTVKDADRVAVLDDGRLAELGTHESLMQQKDGLYRRLVERQLAPTASAD